MLFQDVSCEAEHTIESHRMLGVYELLGADWAGIVVISQRLTVQIDACADLSGTCSDFALSFIYANKRELLELDFTPCNYHIFSHRGGQVVVSFDRSTPAYVVLSIFCKQEGQFEEKDVKWAEIYTTANYKNVLLNNELVQDKDYLENVLESCESAIIVFDRNGTTVSCNHFAEEMFGPDLTGFSRHFRIENQDLHSLIQHVVEAEEKRYLYNVRPLKNDPSRVFNATLAPLRNSKSAVSGAVLVCIDRTEQEYMQQEMELLKNYGLVGEISLGLAHDVKNPLMNIECCSGLMKKHPRMTKRQRELCDTIHHEVERISKVIDQMMSFGNMSQATSRRYVSVDEVLHDCVQIVERQKAGRNICFHHARSDEMPLIMGKKLDFQQIFLNVLINAVQAIRQDGSVYVDTRYDVPSESICVSIRDTGEGIPPETMDKIFEPYFSTKPNGTGLGLFISKRTLLRYGGDIRFRPWESGGTVCEICLPCRENG